MSVKLEIRIPSAIGWVEDVWGLKDIPTEEPAPEQVERKAD